MMPAASSFRAICRTTIRAGVHPARRPGHRKIHHALQRMRRQAACGGPTISCSIARAASGSAITESRRPAPRSRRDLLREQDGSQITCARAELTAPNGVGLSPDEKVLYWADTTTGRLWAADIAKPGELAPQPAPWLPGKVVCTLPEFQLLDSLKVEEDGYVCVGTIINGGITVFDPKAKIGSVVEHVPFPRSPSPISASAARTGAMSGRPRRAAASSTSAAGRVPA